ncbi:MAG: nitrate transporter ATP-binding protein [Verrucomicrobiales bacterium]|nr:nitrate transporter ATP-binding protein [Verrucomicrobiales bacterium]
MAQALLTENDFYSMPAPSTPARPSVRPHRPILRSPRQRVRLGFVPLLDSAPFTVAQELGIFVRHGLEVTLSRELGWASIRDRLVHGGLDAAQAPAPFVYRLRAGVDGPPCEVFSSYILNSGGSAITLSTGLRRQGVRTAADFKRHLRSKHPDRPVVALSSLHSCQMLLLRQWLDPGEIDAASEIQTVVLPAAQMPAALQAGHIDGFCVSEPWNSMAVAAGSGWCPATSLHFPPLSPEKVLLTRTAFADRSPDEHAALLRAMDEACQWCEDPQNRPALTDLLSGCPWFQELRLSLRPALLGPFDCGDGSRLAPRDLLRFHGDGLNFPGPEKAEWILSSMRQANLLPASHTRHEGAFRPDLFEEALGPALMPAPTDLPSARIRHA